MAAGAEKGSEDPKAMTVVQLVAGEAHTLALTEGGSVYAWGRGIFGRIGIGVAQDELFPTYVEIGTDDDNDSQGSSSYYTDSPLAIRDHDHRRSGFFCDRDGVFQQNKIVQVAAGAHHSLALSGDGTVWSWGFNACQLGRERAASHPAPIAFPSPKSVSSRASRRGGAAFWVQGSNGMDIIRQPKIVSVEAGGMMTSAVDQDGGLWLWGAVPPPSAETDNINRSSSSLPDKNETFSLVNIEKPERVHALIGRQVLRVACGNEHIMALVKARVGLECFSWGSNSYGQLGLGHSEPCAVPQLISSLSIPSIRTITDLACGAFHSVVLTVQEDHHHHHHHHHQQHVDHFIEPSSSPLQRKFQPSADVIAHVMASPRMGSQRGRPPTSDHYVESIASPKYQGRQVGDKFPAFQYPGCGLSFGAGYSGSFNSGQSDASSSPKASSRASSQVSWKSLGRMRSNKDSSAMDARLSVCWTFGQGENGQLGHGGSMNLSTPTPVDGLPSQECVRTVVCGQFHTAAVTETGDVWVWGMEGGLGLCPGIGPPGARKGDALTPVRVFGESSAKCHPVMGSKGIACGAAHTVTVANGGAELWAWGRGQSGVLGLGHSSDSWFPSPVVWPPNPVTPSGKENLVEREVIMHFDTRKSSRSSSRAGSRGTADDMIRTSTREPDNLQPARRRPGDNNNGPLSKRGDDDLRLSRGGEYKSMSTRQDADDTRAFRRQPGMEMRRKDMGGENGMSTSDEVRALKTELASLQRYAESLHAALYGGAEAFSTQVLEDHPLYDTVSSDGSKHLEQIHGAHNRQPPGQIAIQEWQQHIETATEADLVWLELFYRDMRNHVKDILFQRRMEDWCRRCMSTLSSSSFQEPPPMPERFSAPNTPSIDGPRQFAMQMSGLLSDRSNMLPPAALAASIAEFQALSQRSSSRR